MNITIHDPIKAVRLDDEGDPVGDVIELPGGSYRLVSRLYVMPDDPAGTGRAWIEDADGAVYEARGLSTG